MVINTEPRPAITPSPIGTSMSTAHPWAERMSRGMQQKIAIARAILLTTHDPAEADRLCDEEND
jgi:ABC-type multidrug transport system ATPase subunit